MDYYQVFISAESESSAKETKEAKIARDADQLELLLCLKEQIDIGHKRAETWIPLLLKRLITEEGKELANTIIETDSSDWWFKKMREADEKKD